MEKKEIKLKIFEADNGIVLVDKSVCAVSVIEREDEGSKEKIYKAIGGICIRRVGTDERG